LFSFQGNIYGGENLWKIDAHGVAAVSGDGIDQPLMSFRGQLTLISRADVGG